MITAFEVGAIFKIIDQASPVLKKILAQVRELHKAVEAAKTSIGGLGKMPALTSAISETRALADAWKGVADASAVASRALGRVSRRAASLGAPGAGGGRQLALTGSIAETQALARAWADVATSSAAAAGAMNAARAGSRGYGRGALPPGVGGAGRGGGGGRHRPGWLGGGHISGPGLPLPGGGHVRLGGHAGGAAMAALGAVAYGVYEQAQVEDIAARAMITGQMQVDPGMRYSDAFAELRKIIQKNSISGGYSPKEVGEAVLGSERQFAGLPFAKRMRVLDTMLPFAMQEGRLKETDLKESSEALVGLAHMTGTYDVAKLPDLYRKFAYASQLTPKALPQYTNALSYSMPSLVGGMGMDPDAVMFLTAMNQAAGIGSSKSGTWIQAFFSKLMPETGANLTHSKQIHNDELRKLGLIDADGKPTWMVPGANGKTDWMNSLMKLSPILGDKLAALPDTQRMQVLDDVFGKQAGREAGLFNLPEFIGQFPQLAKQLRMAVGGDDVLKMYGEGSPVQQGRNAFADLTAVLMNLGQIILPSVVGALKDFDGALKYINSLLPHAPANGGPDKWKVGTRALEGMTIGAGLGTVLPGVGTIVGGAAGGLAGGMYGVVEGVLKSSAEAAPVVDKFRQEVGNTGNAAAAGAGAVRSLGDAIRSLSGAVPGGAAHGPLQILPSNTGFLSGPKRGQPVVVHTALKLDGRTLARATSTHLASLYNYPTQAPFHDGRQTWSPPDMQTITT